MRSNNPSGNLSGIPSASGAPLTFLIDGRSGAGKTTLALELAALVAEVRGSMPQVVHMDDVYRGWWGLASATEILARSILADKEAGYRPWEWSVSAEGPWREIDPAADLIVEGCGALSAATVAAARTRSDGKVCTVHVHAPAAQRKERALARDPGFAEYWEMWAAQEDTHFASAFAADIEVDTTAEAGAN